jgi:hypothetical protein
MDQRNILFFPNPSFQSIQLEGLRGNERVQIYHIDGRLLTLFRTSSETMAININHLRAGIYILRVMDEKGHQVFQDKLIKL